MRAIFMMQSEKKITRANAPAIIKQFAREYRKAIGKAPGEIPWRRPYSTGYEYL